MKERLKQFLTVTLPILLIAIWSTILVDFVSQGIIENVTFKPPPGADCISTPILLGLASSTSCIVSTAVSLDEPLVNVPVFRASITDRPVLIDPLLRFLVASLAFLSIYRLGIVATRKELEREHEKASK